MTTLHRLESATGNIRAGGVLITYPSGAASEIAWESDGRLILPTLDAAKRYAAEVIAKLQAEGRQADLDATNWASVVAALQAHIEDFNGLLRCSISEQVTSVQ
jgi:hypothetical protein